MALFTSYDPVGVKEDVSDIISNISPKKTPFQTSIGTEKVSQKIFNFMEDSLSSVSVNAAIDGADATSATLSPTVLRSSVTQILEKTVHVSGTTDVEAMHGKSGKESAYQIAKASAELKRDLEHALVGTAQTMVSGSSSVARKLASVQAQIASGNIVSTGGTTTAMTEAKLLDGLEVCWTNGSDPSIIMVGSDDAIVLADFAKASGRYRQLSETTGTLTNMVDLYVSPFGEVKVVLNRWLKSTDVLIYDPEMFKLAVLRNWFTKSLGVNGDSTRTQILGEFGLIHRNQAASAIVRRQA